MNSASVATKALIYCRVSSSKQASDGHGLDSQEMRCRQYAERSGYEVEAVFPDDVSGGGDFMKRPGMVALLSYLDAQRERKDYVVIFDDLKRFARDTEFHIQLRRAFQKRHARVECLNFRFDDTPEGKFVETIFAAQGELEREQNRRQVIQKMQARAAAGYWVFCPPIGYRYERVSGHGKLLVRQEPLATIVKEALEAYASGRLETSAEVQRFLQDQPEWPKDRHGGVHPERVAELLARPVYAGCIDYPKWGLNYVPAHHEPLISFETWQAIQDRRRGAARAPVRKDLSRDFPLRGFVACACCGQPMTACWSKGRNRSYGYYLCDSKGCPESRKSFRKEAVEGEFEALLTALVPTQGLLDLALAILRKCWDARVARGRQQLASLQESLRDIERKVDQLLNRLLQASGASVITAYERRVRELESQKMLIGDRIASCGKPKASFDETYRTAVSFLRNPWKLWHSERIEDRRALLRLVFTERLVYARGAGYRTAKISILFKLLGEDNLRRSGVVEPRGIEPLTS
jgi:DNA invertase Pin-like site-specific DNA recombinase